MLSTEPINNGRSTWIRTREWRHQKPLPYRLAIDLQGIVVLTIKLWCGRRDLNSYTLRRQNLNLVRLPIPPLPHNLFVGYFKMVRKERLELSHLAAPEPKSGASTNSAISAS